MSPIQGTPDVECSTAENDYITNQGTQSNHRIRGKDKEQGTETEIIYIWFAFSNRNSYSDRLMLAKDPLAFEVMWLLKYFHNFTCFIYKDSKNTSYGHHNTRLHLLYSIKIDIQGAGACFFLFFNPNPNPNWS